MNFGNPVADPQIQSHAEYLAGQWDRVGFIVTAPFASVDASHPTPHTGIDMGQGRSGGDVLAPADGTVNLLRKIDGVIVIDHGGGWQTVVAHLIQPFEILTGSPVKRGQVIGHVGATGTIQAHLHFEIKLNGAHQDPWPYLNAPTGGDVNLKGTAFEPKNHLTTITTAAGHTEDPTAQPYNNLRVLPAGTAFKVDWQVKGNTLAGTDVWYGGWVFTNPPQFGYVISANCGPLMAVESGGGFTQADLDKAAMDAKVAAVKAGAQAAAKAASDFAATLP